MSEDRRRFPAARNLKVDEILQIYDGIVDDVDRVLAEHQIASVLPLPDMPEGLDGYLKWTDHSDPLPPTDLTDCPDLIIGKLFSFFQNWANYVTSVTTRAKAAKDIQDRHLKQIRAALTIYYREEQNIPASDAPNKVTTDARYAQVESALLRSQVFYETTRDRYDQVKRTLNNISREQTRRREEWEREQHDERGGRGGGGLGQRSRGPGLGRDARDFRDRD